MVDLERVMASLKLMTTLIQTVMMIPTKTGSVMKIRYSKGKMKATKMVKITMQTWAAKKN